MLCAEAPLIKKSRRVYVLITVDTKQKAQYVEARFVKIRRLCILKYKMLHNYVEVQLITSRMLHNYVEVQLITSRMLHMLKFS